jgi:hypothetical protein
MRTFLLIAIFVFSLQAFAIDPMTPQDQARYVDRVASEFRGSFWREGHAEVASRQRLVTQEYLDSYVRTDTNSRYHEPLEDDEISALYRCFYGTNCRLYHIFLTSEYWGGYGEYGAFVLLDIQLGNHKLIDHLIYGE